MQIAPLKAGKQPALLGCGSDPAGFVHPLALAALEVMKVPTVGLESKSWDEFTDRDIDMTITVCEAAGAACPVFPGGGVKVDWPLPDPSFLPGTEEERLDYCLRVAGRIKLKIERLAALDFEALTSDELKRELELLTDL